MRIVAVAIRFVSVPLIQVARKRGPTIRSPLFDGLRGTGFRCCVRIPFEPSFAKPGVLDLSLFCFFVDHFPNDPRCFVHRCFRLGSVCIEDSSFFQLCQWLFSYPFPTAHLSVEYFKSMPGDCLVLERRARVVKDCDGAASS